MNALVVTLLIGGAPFTPSLGLDPSDDPAAARVERDRCLGAGAAGAAGAALGLVVGGGLAFLAGEGVRAADPANTAASKNFDAVAVPLGALAGGMAGLAAATIAAYDYGADLAGKPSVMR